MSKELYRQRTINIVKRRGFTSLNQMDQRFGLSLSNLSRTLETLERYGIVSLHKEKNSLVPEVKATQFQVEFGLQAA